MRTERIMSVTLLVSVCYKSSRDRIEPDWTGLSKTTGGSFIRSDPMSSGRLADLYLVEYTHGCWADPFNPAQPRQEPRREDVVSS